MPAPIHARPEQSFRIPGPECPRELLEILALYDRHSDLYDLLAKVDCRLRNGRDAYFSVFGRYPPDTAALPQDDNVRDVMNALLLSDEFQSDIIPIFLDAYAEKRRLLFIHIPKCAGSDLSNHLALKYPSIAQRLSETVWTSKSELFSRIRDTVLRLKFSDCIFVRDHISLSYYVDHNLIRPKDHTFTILRDPLQIPLSQVNYILTRLSHNIHRERPDPDVKLWLEWLGLKQLPDNADTPAWQVLGLRMLRDTRLTPANPLCTWLGGGSATAVVARLATHGVEVTDTTKYSAWLREKWGVVSTTRGNASLAFVSADDLNSDDLNYIRELSEEDMKLYGIIHSRLSQSGATSLLCSSLG